MNPRIVCIVEGHGDVPALPVLIRRIAFEMQRFNIDVPPPIRCPKSKIVRKDQEVARDELARPMRLATAKLHGAARGGILILLDADDACPAKLGPRLLNAVRSIRPDVRVSVVLARAEYEAWLVAAWDSLQRAGKLMPNDEVPPEPEELAHPKGYLSARMGPGRCYSEPIDQPAMTQVFDLDQASACSSFRKCRREIEDLLRYVCPLESQDE